jgi:hypothetical protein
MAYPEIGEANGLIETRLDEYVKAVEEHMQADVLSFAGPLVFGVDDQIRKAIEARNPRRKGLVVIVETTGGYIEPVQRIVTVLRKHYPDRVDFVVPNYAMSAGTVLVMSGDSIYMDYYSVLGPIDPQVESKSNPGQFLPGLGYLKQYERLIEKSADGELTTAELTFLVQRFDPAELYHLEQSKNLSISLLKEWLTRYKFKNWTKTESRQKLVTQEMREARAKKIADTLNDTERWHSHGRGISIETVRTELELKIEDFGAELELNSRITNYYRLLMDYAAKMRHTGLVHSAGRYVPIMIG